MFSLQQLEQFDHTQAIISNERYGVKCLLTDIPSFSTRANFTESSLAGILTSFVGEANRMAQVINAFLNGGKVLPQFTVQHNIQTAKMWSGSEPFAFSIQCIFIARRTGENPLTPILNLMPGTLPIRPNGSKFVYQAPMAYGIGKDAVTAAGTWTVSIGKWFKARSLLMTALEYTPSKEVTPNGTPLYISATISFETFRVMSITEVQAFFPLATTGKDPWSTDDEGDVESRRDRMSWRQDQDMPALGDSGIVDALKANM